MHRRFALAAFACGLLWLLGVARAQAADASLEYPIKATFLQKFGDFITWPPEAFGSSAGFTVCVFGEDPFGPVLESALGGHTLDGRPMTARRIKDAGEAAGCQIVYFGRSAATQAVLSALKGRPVLTVTDEHSGESGGIIHFVLRDNRVRFAIDDATAAAGGLTISSKLLSIAIAVNPRPRGTP
jgi:hypothetical protein